MKIFYIIFLALVSNVFAGTTIYNRFDDSIYGTDGSSLHRYGNTAYENNGTRYQYFGDTIIKHEPLIRIKPLIKMKSLCIKLDKRKCN